MTDYLISQALLAAAVVAQALYLVCRYHARTRGGKKGGETP